MLNGTTGGEDGGLTDIRMHKRGGPERAALVQAMLGRYRVDYDRSANVLYPRCDTGLFSNCSFTLAALIHLSHVGVFPQRIDFSHGFGSYKDDDRQRDIYPDLFRSDELARTLIPSCWAPYRDIRCPDHHTVYQVLPFWEIDPFIRAYFEPSDTVRALVSAMVDKYQIDLPSTIGLCYRGTDKSTEVSVAQPEDYVRAVLPFCRDGVRVLVQTDQAQAKELFMARIPNSFALEEMPTTTSGTVLHKFDSSALQMKKLDFAKQVLATTALLAHCGRIVNHCGNMALWIALLRGNANGMAQFDQKGRLVGPGLVLAARLKNALRRVRRWARGDIAYYA
jgi:hypothetical protein